MINPAYFLTRNARHFGDKCAVLYGDRTWTYRELNDRVGRLASALKSIGIGKGDRVAIITDTEPRGMECMYAPLRMGAAIVPIGPRLHPAEQRYILENAEASVLLCSRRFHAALAVLPEGLPAELRVIAMDAGDSGAEDYERFLASGDPGIEDADIDADDLAWLFYTSGTTGRPKGAMLTFRNLMTMVTTQLIENNPVFPDDRFAYMTALSHGSGLATFLQMARGAGHVFPTGQGFEPERFYQLVERHRVTIAIMVPTMIEGLLADNSHRKYDLSSLRSVVYGASPMYVERIKAAVETFGPIFIQTYALGEAPRGCTCLPKSEHIWSDAKSAKRLASAGRESFHVQVRVVDDAGRPLPTGQEGEVVIRGDLVMKGYWKNEQATAEAIRNGWLHTGDVGYLDEDGYLFLTDRKKDVIITGGSNVYPREVEDVLYQHAAVHEACVFGAPDAKWGERVVAAIVLRPGSRATEEELIGWCRRSLAGYKKPSQVWMVDQLPKSGIGKVLRREIKQQFLVG